jgi:hypothetical protein
MNHKRSKTIRIMAISPSTRGFGYAVLDGGTTLVDWGVKTVKGQEKNVQSLARAEQLLAKYLPNTLILANYVGARRGQRILELNRDIVEVATNRKIKIRRFTRKQINQAFDFDRKGTRHALAEKLSQMYPEELGNRRHQSRSRSGMSPTLETIARHV